MGSLYAIQCFVCLTEGVKGGGDGFTFLGISYIYCPY